MLSLADLFAALRSRWLLAGGIMLAVLAATAIWAMTQTRVYRASASLLFDISQQDPVDQGKASSSGALLGTQTDIIKSRAIAQGVVDQLNLASQPAAAGGKPAANAEQLAGRLASAVQVTTGKQSNVLEVSYSANDPERAAAIANAFARVYLEKHLQLRIAPARAYAEWFEDRTKDVRTRLEAAQTRLSNYQRERGIIGVDRMDLEAERLRSLSGELSQAEGAAAEASARASAGGGPEVVSSPVVQSLRTNLAAKEAQIAELSKTLGPNHPRMQAAGAEVAALRTQLNGAIGQAAGSLDAASRAARNREADVRARLSQQQQRMLQMSGNQDELMVLQRDVEAARQAYDTVRQRFSEVSLQSELSQTNVSLLDAAKAPVLPVSPNVPLLLLIGAVLGGMLGMTAVIALELMRPKVRTIRGVEEATRQPVLVDLAASRRSLPRRDRLDIEAAA